LCRGLAFVRMLPRKVWKVRVTCQLFFCCRIEKFETRQHVLYGLDIALSIYLVEGLGAPLQGNPYVDAPKAGSNRSSADGFSLFVFLDLSSKHCRNSGHCLEITAVQVRGYPKMSALDSPLFPYFVLSLRSWLHSAIDHPCIRSSCITLKQTLSERWNPVQ